MDEERLFQLYEKLYFHELDRREKLYSRLNLPLTILIGVLGFLAYMLKSAPRPDGSEVGCTFWILFLASATTAGFAAEHFRRAWTVSRGDKLMPTANETETYRRQLFASCGSFPDVSDFVKDEMRQYLFDYYMEFSTVNTINNDSRTDDLHRATVSITVAALLAFLAFVPFILKRVGLPPWPFCLF